jgi:hypothetical protein
MNELLKDLVEFGKSNINDNLKTEVIELIEKLSLRNENIKLFDEGLHITILNSEIELNITKNFIGLNESKISLTKTEAQELYNKILKNSFEG